MCANAQRDGRPAEHTWRPLFNAAKFGWRSLLYCCAVTLPRRETRWNLQGCPSLRQGCMGVLSLRGLVSPIFNCSLAAKLCVRPHKFRGPRTCSRSSITTPSLLRLVFHPPTGWPKTLNFCFVCLFVCLFVRHAFGRRRLCHEGVAILKRFWCRWIGEGL